MRPSILTSILFLPLSAFAIPTPLDVGNSYQRRTLTPVGEVPKESAEQSTAASSSAASSSHLASGDDLKAPPPPPPPLSLSDSRVALPPQALGAPADWLSQFAGEPRMIDVYNQVVLDELNAMHAGVMDGSLKRVPELSFDALLDKMAGKNLEMWKAENLARLTVVRKFNDAQWGKRLAFVREHGPAPKNVVGPPTDPVAARFEEERAAEWKDFIQEGKAQRDTSMAQYRAIQTALDEVRRVHATVQEAKRMRTASARRPAAEAGPEAGASGTAPEP